MATRKTHILSGFVLFLMNTITLENIKFPILPKLRRVAVGLAFLADPDLARALAMLSPDKFEKMIAFLHSPACQRVRTNNHVERTNRQLRYFEKVRYKWRRRRTIVRFVVLALDRWHQRRVTTRTAKKPLMATQKCSVRLKQAA